MSEAKKEYPRPSLTADIVVVALDAEASLRVLCIRRGGPPFQDCWALPGGFCEPGETVMQAAARELTEETGLRDVHLEELRSFTTPGRDPRGWVVSVAHLALLPSARQREARAGDDASEAAWLRLRIDRSGGYRLEHEKTRTKLILRTVINRSGGYRHENEGAPIDLATLAFDHREVLATAVARLREKVETLAFALLPSPFSLGEARSAFEAILGAPLDPAAFARFVAEQGWVREVTLPDRVRSAEQRYLADRPSPRWPWAASDEG